MSTSDRGMHWENPQRTELKYKKQKKENWMFCKVYKENQKELEKCTTSIVCVSYEFDLQQKQTR